MGLPDLFGSPIFISLGSQLTAHRDRLLSGSLDCGTQIHAASFIRDRHIVLDTYLLDRPRLLRLILVHEIFHFVWPRLGNQSRRAYADIIRKEAKRGARGELGESANVGKIALQIAADRTSADLRRREYICESFCDTAAWLYAGVSAHTEFTLATRWRIPRREWFLYVFDVPRPC